MHTNGEWNLNFNKTIYIRYGTKVGEHPLTIGQLVYIITTFIVMWQNGSWVKCVLFCDLLNNREYELNAWFSPFKVNRFLIKITESANSVYLIYKIWVKFQFILNNKIKYSQILELAKFYFNKNFASSICFNFYGFSIFIFLYKYIYGNTCTCIIYRKTYVICKFNFLFF